MKQILDPKSTSFFEKKMFFVKKIDFVEKIIIFAKIFDC